jgi:hypothetical protein
MLWLISISEGDQPFAANYWVSGAQMDATHTESWHPNDSPTDSAYQWIKIRECFDVFGDALREHKNDMLKYLKPSTRGWLKQLEDLDVRAVCAWPHSREDETNLFRLDDHIWIWKGLQATEEIDNTLLQRPEDVWLRAIKEKEGLEESKTYASQNVRQQVIRHFTTKNEISGKRTLAVTRSSRENRFLFHSRDTVLLYARDWAFISDWDSNSVEVWQNAMRVQPDHDGNHESTWENALRYALSILMGLEEFSINKKPFPDMIKDSIATLTRSSSPNGLFVGLLDRTTRNGKKSIREYDRDFYFYAGFEVSYILFRNARKIVNSFKRQTSPHQDSKDATQERLTEVVDLVAPPITQHTLKDAARKNVTPIPYVALTHTHRSPAHVSLMKKSVPVNLLIDANSVVDVDDEWLYNYPGFLVSSKGTPANLTFDQVLNLPMDLILHEVPRDSGRESETLESSPSSTSTIRKHRGPEKTLNRNRTAGVAAVFDVSKKESKREKQRGAPKLPDMLTAEKLWIELGKSRNAELSKKRFVWLTNNEEDIARCCYFSSHNDEKAAMLRFFDKNVNAEHSFHDETTMYLNTWETELHISFFQLLNFNHSNSNNEDPAYDIKFTFPKNGDHAVTKTSMGFRFSGDFFDRFWTCHFVEHMSSTRSEWDLWLPGPPPLIPRENQRAWGQRKVLELHLFERMITAMVVSTRTLFQTLRLAVNLEGDEGDIFSVDLKRINYYESSTHWEDLQQSLKLIIDELEHVNGSIVRWETREADRGAERPRWTWSDEKKYRGDINKLMTSTSHKIQEFRSLHAEIKSFRQWLMRTQEQIREEISFRNSENIKFFTYVTVVFLPLGFASSIFSMSGIPEQDLVRRMVSMAIVALLITIVAIMIAPVIKAGFDQTMHKSDFNKAMKHSLKLCKDNSVLFRLNTRSGETEKAVKADTEEARQEPQQSSNVRQEALANDKASHQSTSNSEKGMSGPINAGRRYYSQQRRGISDTWIWLWYIFTELPARIVVSAYDRMSRGVISMKTVLVVVMGIIVLPWCFIALMARIVVINVADLVSIISCELMILFDHFVEILLTQRQFSTGFPHI